MAFSEDIILGPPKVAFASSRIGGKGSLDLTDRTSRPNDSDEPKNDRFNPRDRFFKDRDGIDKDSERRDGRPIPFNGRRGDKEDWNAGRPRRTFGPEDQDRKPKRNGEFDRWDNNKDGSRDPNIDRGLPPKEGRFARKETQPPRSKYEGSWFRDEHAHDGGAEADDDKPPLRNREWRQNQYRQGTEREWNRGAKLEQEPEWLDTNERDEPRRAHTQEDFERWKERMKAGSGSAQPSAPVEEKKEAHVDEKPETRRTDGEIFSNSGAQFVTDNSMERFFGLLGDSRPPPHSGGLETSTPNIADSVSKQDPLSLAGKHGKSSRFAGLFSPMPETDHGPSWDANFQPQAQPQDPPNQPQLPQDQRGQLPEGLPFPSHSADQEGFQRILQMLGGQRSQNGTPNEAGRAQHQRPPPMMHPEQHGATLSPPSRETPHRPDHMGLGPHSPMTQHAGNDQSLDRSHLLRLMQQVRVGPSPPGNPQSPSRGIAPPPGLMPEGMPRPPPGLAGQKGSAFLDDPAIANMQRPDSQQLRRRPGNGPPMGYFEEMPPSQGNQGPITPGGTRQHAPNQPPMPLQRPPGLEHMPPPGWNGQPGPQQGNGQSPMGPPPGILTPGRGMNPNFPPGMLPMPGNAPPINDRQGFPLGPPPGMLPPPPGYMNGPPPGFPPHMHPHPEAMMGGLGSFGPGSPGPGGPPSSRHLLEMFGQTNGDPRGGMVGPGQFR